LIGYSYHLSSSQLGMIAVGFEKYGSQEELEQDTIKHLFYVYVKVNRDPNVKVEAAKQCVSPHD